MLGDEDRRTLYLVTAASSDAAKARAERNGAHREGAHVACPGPACPEQASGADPFSLLGTMPPWLPMQGSAERSIETVAQ